MRPRQRPPEVAQRSISGARLYKFGKEPERIQKPTSLPPPALPRASGDTLERVLAESSSLPLGAIVMLSDGADNAGGIDLETMSAIRRQRIPVHTIGFGREHPDKDIEIADAVVPVHALPQSKLMPPFRFRATVCREARPNSPFAKTERFWRLRTLC